MNKKKKVQDFARAKFLEEEQSGPGIFILDCSIWEICGQSTDKNTNNVVASGDTMVAQTATGPSTASSSASSSKATNSKLSSSSSSVARETNIAGVVKTPKWSDKVAARNKMASVKEREKGMREAKLAEAQRKKDVTMERRRKKQERERLDEMAKKVSSTRIEVIHPTQVEADVQMTDTPAFTFLCR